MVLQASREVLIANLRLHVRSGAGAG